MAQQVIELTQEEKVIQKFLEQQLEFEKELFAQLSEQTMDFLYEHREIVAIRIAYLEELLLRKRNGF